MAFRFKLEHEDGNAGRPAHAAHGRTELAARRHDPAWACQRDSAGRTDPSESGRRDGASRRA
jgi:hypothetical protein